MGELHTERPHLSLIADWKVTRNHFLVYNTFVEWTVGKQYSIVRTATTTQHDHRSYLSCSAQAWSSNQLVEVVDNRD